MKMLFLCGVSTLALLNSPAMAQEGSWYAGIDGYGTFLGNETATRRNLNVTNSYNTGGGFAGRFGYDFGMLRLETELGKHYNNLGRLEVNTDTTLGLATGNATAGRTHSTYYMFNMVVDFDSLADDMAIEPFVGGGLGVATVKLQQLTGNLGSAYVNSSDDALAYQAFAGVRTSLAENVDLSLRYRFMSTNDGDPLDRLGNSFKSSYDVHDIGLGITYKFGANNRTELAKAPQPVAIEPRVEPRPATGPDPAPVAEIAPAAPPPAHVINKGPFSIYFDWDSSFVSAESRDIIREAILESAKSDQIIIEVDGHADRSGPNGYNDNLSFERAKAVKEALIANGVEENKILIEAYGERMPQVNTDDGVRERQNRRVVIKLN
jgi:OOP family OmpA-OmpF porin